MKFSFFIISILIYSNLFGQSIENNDKNVSKDTTCYKVYNSIQKREIYWVVNKMPEFGDSISDIMNFIQQNLEYPINADIEGNVYLRVTVEIDGKLSDIKILNGLDPLLDKYAIDVIKKMPLWKAGECNGRKVPVHLILPVKFKLH